VNVQDMTDQNIGNFEFQNANVDNTFLRSQDAADLYNIAAVYGQLYPNDQPLQVNDLGTPDGTPAYCCMVNGQPHNHAEHHPPRGGIDLRYPGSDGTMVNDVARSDYERTEGLLQTAATAGYSDPITGARGNYDGRRRADHNNHIHLSRPRQRQ
jgi:hypothetical protein